jgi:hypothetical protein
MSSILLFFCGLALLCGSSPGFARYNRVLFKNAVSNRRKVVKTAM